MQTSDAFSHMSNSVYKVVAVVNFHSWCNTHKSRSVPQALWIETKVAVSYKSVTRECQITVSSKSVLPERCAIVSSKGALQEWRLSVPTQGVSQVGSLENVRNKYCLCSSTYVSAFGFVGFILFYEIGNQTVPMFCFRNVECGS